MNIISKRKNCEYDIIYNFHNHKETLKIIKLISIFLQIKEKINLKDLFNLIKHFYDFEIDTKDYLDYLNQKEGTKFDKTIDIPTNIVSVIISSEGHGKDFSYWSQNYQLMIKAATKDFIPSKEEYTIDEIQQLITIGKIYPLNPFGKKTNKKVNEHKNNIRYLLSPIVEKLDNKVVYFDFMINRISSKIGTNNLLEEIRYFIINLKLDSINDENIYTQEDYKYLKIYSNLADELIILYNKINQEKQIQDKPIDIVLDYLNNLSHTDSYFEEITLEQIINVIYQLDYDIDKEICDEIEKLVILLNDPYLCCEMAANIDWINKDKMAEIVIKSGDPDCNYDYASNVNGADIKKHKEVILNNPHSDTYILTLANSLVIPNSKVRRQ